jgi:uncharacterized membrane protein YdjX (TVP38/TMEM64 family)
MKKYSKKIGLVLFVLSFILLLATAPWESLTFESLRKHRGELAAYVENHYAVTLALFAVAFVSTSFIVPGALILTLAGGFLFGTGPGAVYASLFSTAGSTLAFWTSRYLIGAWVQERHRSQLVRFNEEIARYGSNYLFALRVVPVMPSFLVNYLAGLTRITTPRFMVATLGGILPGALVYSMAGRQLASIESPKDILSPPVIIGFALMATLALLPVVYSRVQRLSSKK